jgi:hypothetical protein
MTEQFPSIIPPEVVEWLTAHLMEEEIEEYTRRRNGGDSTPVWRERTFFMSGQEYRDLQRWSEEAGKEEERKAMTLAGKLLIRDHMQVPRVRTGPEGATIQPGARRLRRLAERQAKKAIKAKSKGKKR